uniref:SCAN box domain-containing protein n=1 Tax=Gopherus evgoodei TaxID=1825980 RepID=A0A8C4VJ16_9SAUR
CQNSNLGQRNLKPRQPILRAERNLHITVRAEYTIPFSGGTEDCAEMCRYRFREFRFQEAEGPQEAYAQLSELCHKWIQPKSKSAALIADMLITEQFLEILPRDVQTWVRKNRPDTGSKAVSLAEYFLAIKEHAQCSTLVKFPECSVREKCRAGKAGSGIMTSRTTNALSEEKLGSLHIWSQLTAALSRVSTFLAPL